MTSSSLVIPAVTGANFVLAGNVKGPNRDTTVEAPTGSDSVTSPSEPARRAQALRSEAPASLVDDSAGRVISASKAAATSDAVSSPAPIAHHQKKGNTEASSRPSPRPAMDAPAPARPGDWAR